METAIIGLLGGLVIILTGGASAIYHRLGRIETSQEWFQAERLTLNKRMTDIEVDNKLIHQEIKTAMSEFKESATILRQLCERVIAGR